MKFGIRFFPIAVLERLLGLNAYSQSRFSVSIRSELRKIKRAIG
jgi:hypothetical protein